MHAKNFLDIIKKYDSGFISLSNKNKTEKEISLIRKKLSTILMGVDYGVSKVIDSTGAEMDLLFVADKFQNAGLKKVLIRCGKVCHQDSILFFPRRKPPLLISTAEKEEDTPLPLKSPTPTSEESTYLAELEIPFLKDAVSCTNLDSFSGFNAVMRKSEAIKIGKECGINLNDLRAEKRELLQKPYIDDSDLPLEERLRRKKEMFFKVIDNINLFMNNINAIKEKQSWYHVPFYSAWMGAIPVGSKHFSLGQILELWKYDGWTTECSCGGKIYVTSATGSLLSGCGGGMGYCDTCRTTHFQLKPLMKYVKPTLRYVEKKLPYDVKIDSLDEVIRQLKLLENS